MSQSLAELRTEVEEYLTEAGVAFKHRGERLSIQRGSTAVFLKPTEWAGKHTMVELLCPVLSHIDCTPELLERVNQLNASLYFGKAYWHDHTLWLAHNLLGDHLDPGELLAASGMIATVADKLDDELKPTFGGRRWVDG